MAAKVEMYLFGARFAPPGERTTRTPKNVNRLIGAELPLTFGTNYERHAYP